MFDAKRKLALGKCFFGLLLIIATAVLGLSPAAWADTIGTVTANAVNIRGGAGTNFERIGQANKNDTFVVVNRQDDWYQIRYAGGVNAWINSQYLATSSNSDLPTQVRALSGTVNIRAGAGTEQALLGTLGSNPLAVTGESGHWYQVNYQGQSGYVAKWLVAADYTAVPPPAEAGNYAPALVNTGTLNLRAQPEGDIVDKLAQDTRLYVRQRQGDWYFVDVNGKQGWVHGDYLLFDQAQSAGQAVAGATPPVFAGAAAQGQIRLSWQQESYGYRLVLEGDSLIHYQLSEGLRSLNIITDMAFNGSLPDNYQLQMLLTGDFANTLQITGTEALHYSLLVEDYGRRLTVVVGLNPLVGRLIYLDPGHGSINENGQIDQGTSDGANLLEKDITYDIVRRMESILREKGAEVLVSRGETTDLTLERRAYPANAAAADVLVSIHVNATTNNPNANGGSTWFYAPADDDSYDRKASKLLADCLQEQLVKYGNLSNYGVREANFAVLRASRMPAVLVETAFITNAGDAAKLADPNWRQAVAEGLCEGLVSYFRQNP